jgi:plasmid stabilization system protein ParE
MCNESHSRGIEVLRVLHHKRAIETALRGLEKR